MLTELTIGSYVSVRSSRYEARGKFGEHERCVRVARGVAESNSRFLSDVLNITFCYGLSVYTRMAEYRLLTRYRGFFIFYRYAFLLWWHICNSCKCCSPVQASEPCGSNLLSHRITSTSTSRTRGQNIDCSEQLLRRLRWRNRIGIIYMYLEEITLLNNRKIALNQRNALCVYIAAEVTGDS